MDVLKRNNPKEFYRSFAQRKVSGTGDLSLNDFFQYFKDLAGDPNSLGAGNSLAGKDTDCVYPELDLDFRLAEVLEVIKSLSRNKSAGIDMIINEYFIEFKEMFAPVLLQLFNNMMEAGYFPQAWAQGVIVPLYHQSYR